MLPDLACCQVGSLRGIKEKVDHAERVNNSTCPGVGFTPFQRRRAFSTNGCRKFTTELHIFVIQESLTESISKLSDLIKSCLHLFGDILRCTPFRHIFLLFVSIVAHQHYARWPLSHSRLTST